MTISNELFNAILSLDAYNRGYDASIDLSTVLGTTKIGNATITTQSDPTVGSDARNIGFYALAYNYDGQTIISYRGTDYPEEGQTTDVPLVGDVPNDIYHGWTVGDGNLASEQGKMAIDFYNQVDNTVSTTISLVGHSLGGGLAGYIGAVYDLNATVFDSMAFESIAQKTIDMAQIEVTKDYKVTYIQGDPITDETVVAYMTQAEYDTLEQQTDVTIILQENVGDYYSSRGVDSSSSAEPDYAGIKGYGMNWEILGLTPWSPNGDIVTKFDILDGIDLIPDSYSATYNAFYNSGSIALGLLTDVTSNYFAEAVARHSQSTLVMTMFSDDVQEYEGAQTSAEYFWPVLYDNDFAENIGMNDSSVGGELQDQFKYADILRSLIAYSALDEGVRPFGDSAIRALYNDANDLGQALTGAASGSLIETIATDISKVFVHFSGLLALNKIEMETDDNTTDYSEQNGILTFNDYTDNQNLTINFSQAYWDEVMGVDVTKLDWARSELINPLLAEHSIVGSEITDITGDIWGNDSFLVFDRVVLATQASGHSTILDSLAPSLSQASLFLGGTGGDIVLGSAGKDFIRGNGGDDELSGEGGNDILIGGAGNDELYGGDGHYDVADYTGSGESVTVEIFDRNDFSVFEYVVIGQNSLDVDKLKEIEIIRASEGGSDKIIIDPAPWLGIESSGETLLLSLQDGSGAFNRHKFENFDEIEFTSGDDIVEINGTAHIHYNGGAGNDTLVLQNPGELGFRAPSFATGTGLHVTSNGITNTVDGSTYEGFETFENVAYAKVDSLGHSYVGLKAIDYSTLSGGAYTADFSGYSIDVSQQNNANTDHIVSGQRGIFIGSDANNSYEFSGNVRGIKLYTGSGNDTITTLNDGSGPGLIYYAGGHDVIYASSHASIVLPDDVSLSDLNSSTLTYSDTHASSVLSISGYGSITFHFDINYNYPINRISGSLYLGGDLYGMRVPDSDSLDNGSSSHYFVYDEWGATMHVNDREYLRPYTSHYNEASAFRSHFTNDTKTLELTDAFLNQIVRFQEKHEYTSPMVNTYNALHGDDTITGTNSGNFINGGMGNDTLIGGNGADYFFGNTGNDNIFGGAGDDLLSGGAGADIIDGEGGINTVFYFDAPSGVFVDLEIGQGYYDLFVDTLSNITNIAGSAYSDVLKGDFQDNEIHGFAGDDIMEGGAGADTFYIGNGLDTILDFNPMDGDKIAVQHYSYNFNNLNITYSDIGSERIANIYGAHDELLAIVHMDTEQYIENSDVTYGQYSDPDFTLAGYDPIAPEYAIDGDEINFKNNYNPFAAKKIIDWHPGDVPPELGWTIESFFDGPKQYHAADYSFILNEMASPFVADVKIGAGGDDDIDAGDGGGGEGGSSSSITITYPKTPHGSRNDDIFTFNMDDFTETSTTIFTVTEDINAGYDKLIIENASYDDAHFSLNSSGDYVIAFDQNEFYEIHIHGNNIGNFGSDVAHRVDEIVFNTASGATSVYLIDALEFEGDETAQIMRGTVGADIISSQEGDDTLHGYYGDDTLEGGIGDDTLLGGLGNDSYVWSVGDGNDFINESNGGGGTDQLVLHGVSAEDLRFEKSGYDVKIHIGSEIITLHYQLRSDSENNTSYDHAQIESLLLDDSTVIDLTSGLSFTGTSNGETIDGYINQVNDLQGKAGNDTLNGGNADDILTGGTGDDTLRGKDGNDTYVWSVGDGNDTIWQESGGADQLVLHGVSAEDLRFEKSGYDVKIHIGSETITLHYQLRSDSENNTSYDHAQIESLLLDDSTVIDLTSGLSFTGTSNGETIDGYINQVNDLQGKAGNDTLNGGNADDILTGGTGDDTLRGKDGNDTYVWSVGDGNDTIWQESGGADQLVLHGVSAEDLRFEKSGYDVKIHIGSETITLHYQLRSDSENNTSYDHAQIESLLLDDSTVINLTSDLSFTGTSDNNTVNGYINQANDLHGLAGIDTLNGGAANDTLTGGAGNDTLNGKDGNDSYVWSVGDGNDTISESNGGGIDQLVLHGVNASDLRFEKYGSYHLNIHINETETIQVSMQMQSDNQNNNAYDYYMVESLLLDDSTVIDLTSGLSFTGTSDNNTVNGYINQANDLHGLAGIDTLNGGAANDTLTGGAGNDTLNGKDGNDSYVWSVGDGNDTISESNGGGIDQLVLHGVNASDLRFEKYGSYHLNIHINETETIQVSMQMQSDNQNDDYYDYYMVESLLLDDDTVIDLTSDLSFTGTSGNDTVNGYINQANDLHGLAGIDALNGGAANDTLTGGAGNDTLNGKGGNDSYIWSVGDGNDIISEHNGGGTDQIVLHGVSAQDLRFEKSSYHLNIHVNEAETVQVSMQMQSDNQNNDYYDYYMVESLLLDDDTVIDLTSDLSFTGTSGNDTVNGYINQTNDLHGLAGIDILNGGAANDTLTGGAGNDTLNGKDGNDSYVWSVGDGNDTISESGGGGIDQLVLHGVDAADLRFEKSGRHLDIHIDETEMVRVSYHLDSDIQNTNTYDYFMVESILLDDATVIDLTSGLSFTGTSSSETMQGYINQANDMYGLGGNDTLYGGAANDILYGGDGLDNLYGYDGADVFMFEAATAFNNIDVIQDFDVSEGDAINIADVLSGYDPLSDVISDFVQITDNGTHSYLAVDSDGGADNFVQIATLNNAIGLTDENALETSGNMITV